MPEQRLQRTRKSLPHGYKFGDALLIRAASWVKAEEKRLGWPDLRSCWRAVQGREPAQHCRSITANVIEGEEHDA